MSEAASLSRLPVWLHTREGGGSRVPKWEKVLGGVMCGRPHVLLDSLERELKWGFSSKET